MSSSLTQSISNNLNKAKDLSKLVRVQRVVSRGGKTFTQFYYVKASEVKSTDVVIGNKQVLDNYIKAKKDASNSKFDLNTFTTLKDAGDRAEALKYLSTCGVTWKVDSSPAINWMRACMSANKASGGKLATATQKKQTSTQNNQTSPASPAPTGSPIQNAGSVDFKTKYGLDKLVSNYDSLTKKEKLNAIKQLVSRPDLKNLATDLGVSWKSDTHPGIDNMRMQMAISAWLDKHTLADFNVKGVTTAKVDKPKNDSSKDNSDKKSKDDAIEKSKLELPPNATPRQVNLVNMINTITSTEDFELFSKSGMIAEDDKARDFIKRVLVPAYSSDAQGASGVLGTSHSSKVPFKALTENMAGLFKNCHKGMSKKAFFDGLFSYMSDVDNVFSFADPRFKILPVSSSSVTPANWSDGQHRTLMDIADVLNYSFSTYDGLNASPFDCNNHYGGDNLKKSKESFDPNKEGFIKVLNKIATDSPELKSECDSITAQYTEMLKLCGYNHKLLTRVLRSPHQRLKTDVDRVLLSNKRQNYYYSMLKTVFKAKGLSEDDLLNTVKGSTYGITVSSSYGISVKDKNGNPLVDKDGYRVYIDVKDDIAKVIPTFNSDLQNLDLDSTGFTIFREDLDVISDALQDKRSVVNSDSDMKLYETLVSDPTVYDKVRQLSLDLVGVSIRDRVLDEIVAPSKYHEMNLTSSSDYIYVKQDIANLEQRETVLTNLLHYTGVVAGLNSMASNVHKNPDNATNSDGTDYGKNFSFYNPLASGLRQSKGVNAKTLDSKEREEVLTSQLQKMNTVTLDGRKKVLEYINAKGEGGDPSAELSKKARSLDFQNYRSISTFTDSSNPMIDNVVNYVSLVSEYCPKMQGKKDTPTQQVQKTLTKNTEGNYKPYTGLEDDKKTPVADSEKLKDLRQKLFSKVHCSIKSADTAQQKEVEHYVKQNWDLRNPDGSPASKQLYRGISAKFHTGAYYVNNSESEERLNESAQKLGEKPQTFFHGTSYAGSCGIVGVDGKFRPPSSAGDSVTGKYAGAMLGSGVYLAKQAGKSAGYFGNWGSSYGKGCMLICEAVLGKTHVSGDFASARQSAGYDTVSMQAGASTGGGRTLRADEWCVKKPEYVHPKIIVDMEAVTR